MICGCGEMADAIDLASSFLEKWVVIPETV